MRQVFRLLAVLACSVALPAAASAQRFAIVGAEVFDGTGAAPKVATVVVKDGLIESVTPGSKAPKGVTQIKGAGLALLPGLYDVHTHYTPSGSPASPPQISAAYIASGVTTVNDFHQQPESYAARRAWYEGLPGPHVRFAARMSTPGGHGADWADINTTRWANTPYAAKANVEAVVPYKPDFIKAFTDGWRYGSGIDNTSMDLPTLTSLVKTAHENNLEVVTHTVTVERGKIAAKAGVDVIVHSLQDFPIDAETIELMKKGTAYAPTLAVYEPVKPGQTPPADKAALKLRTDKFQIALDNVKKLSDAGILIAVGTDAGMPGTPHGSSTLRELELLVQAGLTPVQALTAGTSGSAKAMGLKDRGVIAPGMKADLVLVKGKPWAAISDIRNVQRTFVDGKTVFGPGAPKPVERPTPAAIALASPQIVDFEKADGRTNAGSLIITDGDGGVDRSVQVMAVADGEGGGHFLDITAKMAQRADPETQVVIPLTPGSVVPVDVRKFTGIRFDARGKGDYEVGVTASGTPWTGKFDTKATWGKISVPFSAFKPELRRGEGAATKDSTWAGDDVTDVRFTISRPGGVTTWLEIDNVELY